jgi:hypothetical protein
VHGRSDANVALIKITPSPLPTSRRPALTTTAGLREVVRGAAVADTRGAAVARMESAIVGFGKGDGLCLVVCLASLLCCTATICQLSAAVVVRDGRRRF